MALCVPERCFWPAKTRKNLEFLRCLHVFDRVLKCGSDINEGNWLQVFFYFFVLVGIVASVVGMGFFQLCFRFYFEAFLYCSLTETVAIGFQKWFDHEWIDFVIFCWKMASIVDFISVWTESKNWSFVILFCRHHFFSMFRLRGILVGSLKMFLLFSHRIL